jgi:DNA-binding response OmpR family regulator
MIGESIEEGLRGESYAVDWVRDGSAVELALSGFAYDLMLLDLGLPGKQGMDVLRSERGDDLPVLIITARDGTPARVEGLDAGADDYLVKPFDLDELLARIRALLRRRVSRTRPSSCMAACGSTSPAMRRRWTDNRSSCRRANSRCCAPCWTIRAGGVQVAAGREAVRLER